MNIRRTNKGNAINCRDRLKIFAPRNSEITRNGEGAIPCGYPDFTLSIQNPEFKISSSSLFGAVIGIRIK